MEGFTASLRASGRGCRPGSDHALDKGTGHGNTVAADHLEHIHKSTWRVRMSPAILSPVHADNVQTAHDLRVRLAASEAQRRAGREELRRTTRELALARRVLAELLGKERPARFTAVGRGEQPGAAAAAATPVTRVPAAGWTAGGLVFSVDRCEAGPAQTVVTGWAFCPAWDARQTVVMLVLVPSATDGGEEHRPTFTVLAHPVERPDVAAHFAAVEFPEAPADGPAGRHLTASGFTVAMLNASLPAGSTFDLFLHLECEGSVPRREPTGQRLEF